MDDVGSRSGSMTPNYWRAGRRISFRRNCEQTGDGDAANAGEANMLVPFKPNVGNWHETDLP
jgi:hypothetical protein